MDPILSRLDGHDRQLTELRQEIKVDFAAVRQELKDESARLRQELKAESAQLRQEIKAESAQLRQEIKAESSQLRQEMQDMRSELKDEIRGLHVRFEGLESTMKLVAERVGDFNRESQSLRGRVNTLETQQINTDLRLIALERKKRKS